MRHCFLYLLFLTGLINSSCTLAQQKENKKKQDSIVKKPKFLEVDDLTDPNTVNLKGSVLAVSEDTIICEKLFKTVLLIKVDQLINYGVGIVNPIAKGQKVTFTIESSSINILGPENQQTIIGQSFTINAKENLCAGMNQTFYSILKFE